jgi:hypothetical protein
MGRTLIQIVPSLPPATNGVGDYALTLACVLREEFGINTEFVVGNDQWQGPERVEGFRARRVAARSSRDLEQILEPIRSSSEAQSVLLQLSIYGYAARGCPLWLLDGLKRWKSKQKGSQLITMFHELYAFGPPWKSAFWVSPAQRMVIGGLARLSEHAASNTRLACERLEIFDPSKRQRIPVLAIPSGVGEPEAACELVARERSMVVFGQAPLRKRAYGAQFQALQQACLDLGITCIHDAGASFDGIPERVGDVPVIRHGLMTASELSQLLAKSLGGFIDYPGGCLAKSSVFGSYVAHRMVPVVASDNRSEADGLLRGTHYYCVEDRKEPESLPKLQSIADAAWNWYQGHSLRCHARAFAEMMGS